MNSLTSSPTERPLARLTVRRKGESVTPLMGARISGVSIATSPIWKPEANMVGVSTSKLVTART